MSPEQQLNPTATITSQIVNLTIAEVIARLTISPPQKTWTDAAAAAVDHDKLLAKLKATQESLEFAQSSISGLEKVRDQWQREAGGLQQKVVAHWDTIQGLQKQIQDLKLHFQDCQDRNSRILKSQGWPLDADMWELLEGIRQYFPLLHPTIEAGTPLFVKLHDLFYKLTQYRETTGQQMIAPIDYKVLWQEEQRNRVRSDKEVEELTKACQDWKERYTKAEKQLERRSTAELTFRRIMEFGRRFTPTHASPDVFEKAFWEWYQEKYPTEQ